MCWPRIQILIGLLRRREGAATYIFSFSFFHHLNLPLEVKRENGPSSQEINWEVYSQVEYWTPTRHRISRWRSWLWSHPP